MTELIPLGVMGLGVMLGVIGVILTSVRRPTRKRSGSSSRYTIKLDEEQWLEFQEILNREPRDCPRLRELFARPTIFEEEQ